LNDALLILLGCLVGGALVLVVVILRRRQESDFARRLLDQAQADKAAEVASVIEQVKTAFGALSREALSANTDDFLKLAGQRLDHQGEKTGKTLEEKRKLIDGQLQEMKTRLSELNTAIQNAEKRWTKDHGALTSQLEQHSQAARLLRETTGRLHEALANPQRRGQWGERMAEDVLRLAGFVEGVNYVKQQQLGEGTRPDFTFSLPGNRQVHMDVKFPLANYLKMLDAGDESGRAAFGTQFLRDVRSRVKEVTTRAYINPAEGTVDYVLVFIPNEQVYAFIHERDADLLDDAMKRKVVLCSPMTLYAILAVIRQGVENFRLEQSSRQILDLLGEFGKQWRKYVERMDRMGERLGAALKEYENLVGVRTRQLDRQLDKVEDLRAAREQEAAGRMLESPALPSEDDAP
jgi:DNA recombination protein RmuC